MKKLTVRNTGEGELIFDVCDLVNLKFDNIEYSFTVDFLYDLLVLKDVQASDLLMTSLSNNFGFLEMIKEIE